jgi:hypothetical protein
MIFESNSKQNAAGFGLALSTLSVIQFVRGAQIGDETSIELYSEHG